MNLAQAREIAEGLRDLCAPAAERIEIAGSIRREKPVVKDIELVAIPRFVERQGAGQMMLGAAPPVVSANLMREAIEARPGIQAIKPGVTEVEPWHLTTDGAYWRLYLPRYEIKVDVFLCTPATWGLNLMIRTGSGVGPDGVPAHGFGPGMLQRWKAISGGGSSQGLRLTWPDGRREETPEERDVFAACRVEWVEPRERTSARAVREVRS